MHKRLVEHGVDSRLVLVDGAEHEHDFWSPQVFDMSSIHSGAVLR